MQVLTRTVEIHTKGFMEMLDVTSHARKLLDDTGATSGSLTCFIPGSTAGLTTIEFESGALADLKDAIERIAPQDLHYNHDARWGDGNGFAHVRAALLGPSLTIPVVNGALMLGTWQQVLLIDFDNRPRNRELLLQFIGE